MTTVYGVTYIGAREQIEKQLREKSDIPTESRYRISAYVAKRVCVDQCFSFGKNKRSHTGC